MVVLALLAVVPLGQLDVFADAGNWSEGALHRHALSEPGVGAMALLVVLGAASALALAAWREGLALRAAYHATSRMGGGELVVGTGGLHHRRIDRVSAAL